MRRARSQHCRYSAGLTAVLFAVFALLATPAVGQPSLGEPPAGLDTKQLIAFDSLRHGEFGPVTEAEIAAARSGQLLPILEERFAHATDREQKSGLAIALIRAGDTDETYWKYLADPVEALVKSAPPEPVWCPDPPGGCPAEKGRIYAAWARAHGITEGSAQDQAVRSLPNELAGLAAIGDRRGIPLFLEALRLPGFEVEAAAALGLAEADDRDAIPLIIDACRRASPEGARNIAGVLNLFNDPRAKSAAAAYLPQGPDPMALLAEDEETAAGDSNYLGALPSSIEEAVTMHRADAMPLLERKFSHATDSTTKAHCASALVRLGDRDPEYWNYLLDQTKAAVESDTFPILRTDAQGKVAPISPEDLNAWAQAHGTTAEAAANAERTATGMTRFLALTGDPRGIGVLRDGLHSSDFVVQSFAAKGLAKLQDKDSIPLIIDACSHAPAEVAGVIARALLYFKDPQAQTAAEKYISADDLDVLRAEGPLAGTDPFR
jgi:HEAT repeat protein